MKNLYLIHRKNTNPSSLDLLTKSAAERGIGTHSIFVEDFDFSKRIKLTEHDGLYKISTGFKAGLVEKFLINDKVSTFYSNYLFCIGKFDNVIENTLIHKKNNLPTIKTVFSITRDRRMLKKYVDCLDGFPIIVKSFGGSHGIGVMKLESFESLVSVCDYLGKRNNKFIMRKYINYKEQARIIVLGNKVIASIEYPKIKNDFRSNTEKELHPFEKKFSKRAGEVAISAVNLLGWEFGGVDLLIDQKGDPFIAEVNLPCYFPRAQEATGIDISGKMIDHLINK